ncbi:transglutaminase domain-containing protein [Pseudoclavibacter chungangensis]|uniref:Transglutaminase domain-containing protein n=1 Tax=Pseudoclavibacter chungangensis TaxID=587635 RepID=A0A7J5BZ70_9MICO|nr:transglutaminase-like domain-containing protein [Pseudoclavibacter chungangensis]KAB1659646.1 transglutaminase domain-containing protein [Pseudoclavibacter chungangensis]NYJ67481.1 hypothetical protein [Pseudoclavibacter chungangensis]
MAAEPRVIRAQLDVSDASGGVRRGRRATSAAQWRDLAVVVVLTALAMAGFQPPYGGTGFVLATLGGVVVGVGSALVGYLLRLNALNTVLIGVLAYFLLGTPFVLPGDGIAVVVPTLESLGALAVGAVASWRDSLTLATPITGPDHMAVLPYVATAAATLTSSAIVLHVLPRRPRSVLRAAAVLLGPVALLALTMAMGTDRPFLAITRGTLFALVALVWLSWSTRGRNAATGVAARTVWTRRLAGTAVIALAAGVVAGGIGDAASLALDRDRFVLREEVTPPFDPYPYQSPLAGFRTYTKDLRDVVLFEASGLQQGDSIKLATLDQYSGRQWEIASPSDDRPDAGAYTLVGREVSTSDFLVASSDRDVEFRIDAYKDLWLPSVGSPTSIDLTAGPVLGRRDELRFNGATGTGLVIGGLEDGDAYGMHVEVQDQPMEGQLDNVPVARLRMPDVAAAPAAVTERMQTYIQGESSDYLRLKAIELALRSQGYLSHGTAGEAPSRAGHGLDRMQGMFELRYLVGDEEQYVSAMALMAHELGFPVRVVVGFKPPSVPADGGAVEVRGGDVTAWVEVPFEGFGWVAFSPTPEQTDVPVNTQERPETKPKAQVRQPPQTEARPDDLITAADDPGEDDRRDEPFTLPAWLTALITVLLVPLVAIGGSLLVAAVLRGLRVRARRDRGSPDERAAGAFDEAVDRFAELGYAVPEHETRRRTAGAMHPALATLAVDADRAVFDASEPTPEEVARVWAEAERAADEATAESSRGRRLLARFLARRPDRRDRTRRGERMNADRALLRNRILRSHGSDRPSPEAIARIEGIAPERSGDARPTDRDGT